MHQCTHVVVWLVTLKVITQMHIHSSSTTVRVISVATMFTSPTQCQLRHNISLMNAFHRKIVSHQKPSYVLMDRLVLFMAFLCSLSRFRVVTIADKMNNN